MWVKIYYKEEIYTYLESIWVTLLLFSLKFIDIKKYICVKIDGAKKYIYKT
jgi:hypothetical protein